MIQIIKYKCCSKIFAACHDPHCYTDRDWIKNLRKYVLDGHKAEMIESGKIKFEKCDCKKENTEKVDVNKTLDLFSQNNL